MLEDSYGCAHLRRPLELDKLGVLCALQGPLKVQPTIYPVCSTDIHTLIKLALSCNKDVSISFLLLNTLKD